MTNRPLNDGRTPKFLAREATLMVLSASIRERRRQARLAYEIDPGMALAEQLAGESWAGSDGPSDDSRRVGSRWKPGTRPDDPTDAEIAEARRANSWSRR